MKRPGVPSRMLKVVTHSGDHKFLSSHSYNTQDAISIQFNMDACFLQNVIFVIKKDEESPEDRSTMAEVTEESNGDIRHSRTSSSTSSEDAGLVLSVTGLNKGQSRRPNSGNNNTRSNQQPNSLDSENVHLRAELEVCKNQLKTKEDEVAKLSKIRDELENEVQELTASLFEEAHKMVGEANTKAAASERSLEEASMKIEGLETEVAALKDMVLTSTPSKPNRHLHPQLDKKSKKSLATALDLNQSASIDMAEKTEEKLVDPVVHKEYMLWKKSPTLRKENSEFLQRLYTEDVVPCMTFPNLDLTSKLMKAVETNNVVMSPIVFPKDSGELPNHCALFECPLVCQFKVTLEDNTQMEISQLARNRIAATCECLNYLRYICEGLVKAHHNEVYWEIMKRRKKMSLAKLGYSPEED